MTTDKVCSKSKHVLPIPFSLQNTYTQIKSQVKTYSDSAKTQNTNEQQKHQLLSHYAPRPLIKLHKHSLSTSNKTKPWDHRLQTENHPKENSDVFDTDKQ